MPRKNVYVWTALWNLDTWIDHRGTGNNTSQVRDLTSIERFNLLARVVEKAYLELGKNLVLHAKSLVDEQATFLFLFVAPEYLFAASDTAHAIPQSEKDDLVGRLKALSLSYPYLILVPGTIAWKKPVVRTIPESYKRDKTTGLRTNVKKERTRLSKFNERVDFSVNTDIAIAEHRVDLQIKQLLADPLVSLSEKKRLQNPKYRDELIESALIKAKQRRKETLTNMSVNLQKQPDRCFVARNTCYAFYAGKEVARYHKRGDFHEVVPSESDNGYIIFEPGGGPDGNGDMFEVESVKFGIEICLDHNYGFLSQTSSTKPDVHIIVSAAVKFVNEHAHVPPHHWIVHASSSFDYTAAYGNSGYEVKRYDTTDIAVERGTLRCCRLFFDVPEQQVLTLEDMIVNK
jgi:hypothetical protein